jgi:hypothetical protein
MSARRADKEQGEGLYQEALRRQKAGQWEQARPLWERLGRQADCRDRAQPWLDAYRRFDDKIVLAYYYIWFKPESFDASRPGALEAMRDIHPVLGAYDSRSPAVIEAHVNMAKKAGLDAFAVSWWTVPEQSETLARVVEIGAAHGLRSCIDLEACDKPMPEIEEALRYFLSTYQDDRRMLRKEDKPVVLVWGTWLHPPTDWQALFDRLKAEGLEGYYLPSEQGDPRYLGPLRGLETYTLVDVEDDQLAGHFRTLAAHVRAYNETPQGQARPAQWDATLMPGFDERGIPGREYGPGGAGWKDRRNGAYYRHTFEAALASDPDWLHVTSFNELAEHSHIEPMEEFGDQYLSLTAEFARAFKATAFRGLL